MTLFSTYGWLETVVNSRTEKRLEEWKVDTYAQNTFLFKIPEERIAEKRAQIRKEETASVYFWRKWWSRNE